MAKLVCDTSLLKNNDYRVKRRTFGFKVCSRCDLGILESAKHFIMQCPFYEKDRSDMYDEINQIDGEWVKEIVSQSQEVMYILLSKHPEEIVFSDMIRVWLISGKYISKIYRSVIIGRK